MSETRSTCSSNSPDDVTTSAEDAPPNIVIPRISVWLSLSPAPLERLFWRSQVIRRAIYVQQLRSLVLSLLFGTLSLLWQQHRKSNQALANACISILQISTSLFQYSWFVCAPQSFEQYRGVVRVFHRLCLMLGTLHSLTVARNVLARQSATAYPAEDPYSAMPALLISLNHQLAATGVHALMMHSFHTTLTFPHEIVFDTISTLLLVVMQAAPAVSLLKAANEAAQYQAACTFLNNMWLITGAGMIGAVGSNEHLDNSCYEAPEQLLVLFTILFFGLVVPVYYAARMECHLKHLFLLELAEAHAGDGWQQGLPELDGAVLEYNGAEGPLLRLLDAVLAALLAAIVWGLVVLSRPVLWRLALPVRPASAGPGQI